MNFEKMDPNRKSKSMNNLNASTSKKVDKRRKLRILTVDISTALGLGNRTDYDNNDNLLEIFADVLAIRDGVHSREKLIMLRSPNEKPVMQGVYYTTSGELPPIEPGQMTRVVGNLLGTSRRIRIVHLSPVDRDHCIEINRNLKKFSLFEISKGEDVRRKDSEVKLSLSDFMDDF